MDADAMANVTGAADGGVAALEGTFASLAERFVPDACPMPGSPMDLVSSVVGDSACFKAVLATVLGLGVVVFASIIKVPQILKILSAKSASGLSRNGLLIETFGYAYNLAAHSRQGFPFTTYGDFAMILSQNLIILVLMSAYSHTLPLGLATAAAFLLFVAVSALPRGPVPLPLLVAMTGANALMPLLARAPQIYENWRNKSTGQLSPVTCAGMFMGTLARIFTTVQQVPSVTILAGYLVSAVCNGTLVVQILYYGGGAARKRVETGKKDQ